VENAKVNTATEALVVMRSVDPSANPKVPMNQLIPNFPATPDAVTLMPCALSSSRASFLGG
jgi:hypothetical protein